MSRVRFFLLKVDIMEAPRKIVKMPVGTSQSLSGMAVYKIAPILEKAMKYRASGIFDGVVF